MPSDRITSELLALPEVAKLVHAAPRTGTRSVTQGRTPFPLNGVLGQRGTVRWKRSKLLDPLHSGCKSAGGGA